MEKSTIGFLVVISLLFPLLFGHLTKVPVVSDASEKFWNHAEPAIVETKNFLEETYQKIFGSESNSKTGPGESSSSSNESLQSVDPPDISASIQTVESTQYIGDNPSFEITVTNSGGPCEVEYTAFESQPESGSFHLDSGESETITETGGKVSEIGNWNAPVDVSATNEGGSDQASDTTYFDVTFHHVDGDQYIDYDELSQSNEILSEIGTFADRFLNVGLAHRADAIASLVTPDSSTIQNLANEFKEYHPNNQETLARDLYYWTIWWLGYEGDRSTQWEIPVETIEDRDGVCINYAAVLASLYEACGLDAKVMDLWNEGFLKTPEDQHAVLLLNLPGVEDGNYYEDGWLYLDPTWGDTARWEFGEYHHDYECHDISDVE